MAIERVWPAGPLDLRIPGIGRPYCQVVRAPPGRSIHVSGTQAVGGDGAVVAPGDMAAQTRCVMQHLLASLAEFGADAGDVVRTRTYVTDLADYLAHGYPEWLAVFADRLPASTTVGVSGLVLPGAVVEIEAYAVIT